MNNPFIRWFTAEKAGQDFLCQQTYFFRVLYSIYFPTEHRPSILTEMPDGGPFRCAYEGEGLLCQGSESTVCDFITSSGDVQAFSHLSTLILWRTSFLLTVVCHQHMMDIILYIPSQVRLIVMNRPLQNQNISLSGLSSGMYLLGWWILKGASWLKESLYRNRVKYL